MNFYDKIEEMGYRLKEKNEHYIMLIKEERISDAVVLFDIDKKTIHGYLKPNDLIMCLDDISHQYTVFRELQSDLKEFATISKYAIIN